MLLYRTNRLHQQLQTGMKNTTTYFTKHKDNNRDKQILLDYVCPRQTISKASKMTDLANFMLEKLKSLLPIVTRISKKHGPGSIFHNRML